MFDKLAESPSRSSKMQLSYSFGEFRIDAKERVLFRCGKLVPLAPKVLDTLLVLLKNNGHVLEKKELMDAVWPNSFVQEVNLAHNVSVLRKILGKSSKNGKFIQTIPKRGYLFTCDLRPLSDDPASFTEATPSV